MECYDEAIHVCPHCGYVEGTPAREAYHLTPGTILNGKYQVGRVLGYGGFGVTYIGYDRLLGHKIAIKEYLPGEFATRSAGTSAVTIFTGDKEEQFYGGIRKFSDEAKRLAQMDGVRGVVRIIDTFSENNTSYIVMEYLDGENLKQRLDREKKIPVEEAIKIILPVLDALQSVHEKGMLHRDISPDNIFLTKSGEVKLLDFGAARYATTAHSRSLSVIVKQGFAPEEQYRSRGNQGTWTDVYACGATLYKMITGVTPEDAMERKEKDELLPPSKLGVKVDKNTETAIMNAMNILIEDRTQTAAEFKEELTSETGVKVKKSHLKIADVGKWPKWVKIASSVAAAAIVTVLILALAGVFRIGPDETETPGLGSGQLYMIQVTGRSVEDARAALLAVDLSSDTEDGVYSTTPAGWVYEQSIDKGQIVEKGTVIQLTFSKGLEKVTLEDLAGKTKAEAEAWLKEMGFTSAVEEIPSSIEPGTVVRTDPEPGDIDKGSEVKLYISKGMENLDPTKETTVPDVVGKTEQEAERLASDAGMYIKTKKAISDTVPEGQVISQSPKGGAKAHEADTLEVVVSEGAKKKQKVPSIMYEKKNTAASRLSERNLKAKYVYKESDYPTDTVIGVSPSVGSNVYEGDTITVTLSRYKVDPNPGPGPGPEPTTSTEPDPTTDVPPGPGPVPKVSVPNVVGKSVSGASSTLSGAGLKLGDRKTEWTTNKSNDGKIKSQSPGSGSSVNQGTAVDVVVYAYDDPKPKVSVPNIAGKSVSDAKTILSGSGLKLGTQSKEKTSNKNNDGKIKSQDPKSGSSVDQGSTVNVVVYEYEPGPVTISVPNVVGKSVSDASAILSNSGFKLGTQTKESTTTKSNDGKIKSQDPKSGSSAEKGAAVNVVVYEYSDEYVTVPVLTNYKYSQASSVLAEEQLVLGSNVSYYHSDSKSDGMILAYSPSGKVKKGTTITVSVCDNSKKTLYRISRVVSTETVKTTSANPPANDTDTVKYYLVAGSPKTEGGVQVWYWTKLTWGPWSDYGETEYQEEKNKIRVETKTVNKYPDFN